MAYADTLNDALFKACKRGDVPAIRRMIAQGRVDPRLNVYTYPNQTPLHVACRAGKVEVIRVLIDEYRCFLTFTDWSGNTLLHHACWNGHIQIVKYLADECKVNVGAENYEGSTPLHLACRNGKIEVVNLLIKGYSCSTISVDKNGNTPLHDACLEGQVEVVKVLIEKYDCSPMCTNNNGATALRQACLSRNPSVVEYLVNNLDVHLNCKEVDDSPVLHWAFRRNWTNVMEILIEKRKFDPNTPDTHGHTVLHLACQKGDVQMVNYLLNCSNATVSAINNEGSTPLHLACQEGKFEVVKVLIEKYSCSPTCTDNCGNTPLHQASLNDHILVVKYLAEHCKLVDVNASNYEGYTPLDLACRNKSQSMVEYLVTNPNVNLSFEDDDGSTILHLAFRLKWSHIMEILIDQRNFDAYSTDCHGHTILQLACQNEDWSVIECLVSSPNFKLTYKENDGSTLLHLAYRHKLLNVIDILIKKRMFDVNSTDSRGRTVLHLACQEGNLKYTKALIEEYSCSLTCTDNKSHTPLSYACRECHMSVVEYLVRNPNVSLTCQEFHGSTILHLAVSHNWPTVAEILTKERNFDANSTDSFGRTALQLACWRNQLDRISWLIDSVDCDPNFPLTQGDTPLDLARSPEVIRLLLQKGARPTYFNMEKCFPEEFQMDPADMSVKVFILGDPGAGKSTLVKSIKKEGSRVKYSVMKVRNVEEKTAGIIPHEINLKTLGRAILYDFAGHREFYAGHDAVLRNSLGNSPSIVILVVNMKDNESKIKETVQYWFEFLAQQEGTKPHLVVVGSHIDEMSSNTVDSRFKLLRSLTSDSNIDIFTSMEEVMLDCRYPGRSAMSKLRTRLSDICLELRSPEKLEFACHSLLVFLLDKFRIDPAITLTSVEQEIRKVAEQEVHWTFMKSLDLASCCEKLNKQGSILFMKNQDGLEKSWVIIDKGILLSRVNGKLFAPGEFKEYEQLASSTGVVPQSKLVSLFPDLDQNMITQFLCHLEFCREIIDANVLNLLYSDDTMSFDAEEKFFFFPALVQLERPIDLWQSSDELNYHTGWIMKCSNTEQFLSPRFLQVLLLRLAFWLALAPSNVPPSSIVLHRKCSVWKNGISWASHSGVEAVVEVVDQKYVVVLTRSKNEKLESVHLRSLIIQTVLSTKSYLCPKVITQELLIHPKDTLQYPTDLAMVKNVSIIDVAQRIKEGKKYVVLENREILSLQELLHFEAYATYEENVLQDVFDDSSHQHHQQITSKLRYRIAEHAHKNIDEYITMLKPSQLRLANSNIQPGDIHKLAQVLQLWKEKMGSEGTLCCLHSKLDQFSVFAGRNPLRVAEGELSLARDHCSSVHMIENVTSEVAVQDHSVQLQETETQEDTDVLKRDEPPTARQLEILHVHGGRILRIRDKVAPSWKYLAAVFGFDDARIEVIDQSALRRPDEACRDMLSRWLRGDYDLKPISWNILIQCLNDAGLIGIAKDLEEYVIPPTNST